MTADHHETLKEALAGVLEYYDEASEIWTDKGWPRPRSPKNGLPVPWVSPTTELKQTHPRRMAEVVEWALCQVCGLEHTPSDRVYLFINDQNEPPADLSEKNLQVMDNAILHERCFRLAYGCCPALRELRLERKLLVFTCERRHVKVYSAPDEDDQFLGVEGEFVRFEQQLR